MTKHKASAEQWAQIEGYAATDLHDDYAACLLDIRARVEALEASQPKQITQEELARRLAQPASVVPLATAPTGSLVETPDELKKLLSLMHSGAGICHSEGYEELHDAICRGVDLLERLTRQQPESIDEAENDRRFKACMAAIDAATPEQIRAAAGLPEHSSLVERVADAIVTKATSAGIVDDRPARAAIREVAAWLKEEGIEVWAADFLFEQVADR